MELLRHPHPQAPLEPQRHLSPRALFALAFLLGLASASLALALPLALALEREARLASELSEARSALRALESDGLAPPPPPPRRPLSL